MGLPHQTTGDLITATIWNNQVDVINTLYGGTAGQFLIAAGGGAIASFQSPQQCITHNSTTQAITGDNADHALTFDTNDTDPQSMHSVSSNTSRITVPVAGFYLVVGSTGSGGTSANYTGIRKNGAGTIWGRVSGFGGQNIVLAVVLLSLAASDYVELIYNCSANNTLGHASDRSQQTQFSISRVG